MSKNNKRNKQVKIILDLEEPLFLLVKNGEELPSSSCTCTNDDALDIDGLEDDNQLIDIDLSDIRDQEQCLRKEDTNLR